jgi:hypothetical protein
VADAKADLQRLCSETRSMSAMVGEAVICRLLSSLSSGRSMQIPEGEEKH